MSLPIGWLVAMVLSAVVLFFLQPLVLKGACSLCGEEGPRYWRGMGMLLLTSLFASIAVFGYHVTIGGAIGVVSGTLASLGALAVSAVVTSIAYSAFLRISVPRAAKVALVHHVIGVGISALAGWVVSTFVV